MTETTKEQRALLLQVIPARCEHAEQPAIVLQPQVPIVRAAVRDADRLAQIERRERELVERWDERARNAGHNEGGGKIRECAKELRAIIAAPDSDQ